MTTEQMIEAFLSDLRMNGRFDPQTQGEIELAVAFSKEHGRSAHLAAFMMVCVAATLSPALLTKITEMVCVLYPDARNFAKTVSNPQ